VWMEQSPDGKVLAAQLDEEVVCFDPHTGTQGQILKGPGGRVVWVTFSRNGRTLAAVTDGPQVAVHLWDLATIAGSHLAGPRRLRPPLPRGAGDRSGSLRRPGPVRRLHAGRPLFGDGQRQRDGVPAAVSSTSLRLPGSQTLFGNDVNRSLETR
jgi:hypothetical protein